MQEKEIITTDSSKCRQCYSCVRNCPVKAVEIKNGRAHIMQSRCIQCGNCLKQCKRSAKVVYNYKPSVKRLLSSPALKIALIAPSFVPALYPLSPSEITSKLKCLGFDEIWETAIGAEYVIDSVAGYLKSGKKSNVLSSACPAFVSMIEKHYPSLIPELAPVCSPMIATARIIKGKYKNKKTSIIFIGPCIAKKEEIEQEQYENIVDAAVTFKEFTEMLIYKKEQKNEKIKFYTASKKGRSIPFSGGIINNINKDFDNDRLVETEGAKSCIELARYIENNTDENDFLFFDTLMCRGCIDGPGINNNISIYNRRKILNNFISAENSDMDYIEFNEKYHIDMSRSYTKRQKELKEPDEEDIRKILSSIDKKYPEDELDCGACGYESCRDKAKAVYMGIAEEEMCLPYLLSRKNELYEELLERYDIEKQLNDELNAVFESSYDGLIVCDSKGKIIKTNSAFIEMTGIKKLPDNVIELEEKRIIYPSATLLAVREKRRITFMQEGQNGKKFIATGNPVIDKNGNIFGVVTNIRDIDELNRLKNNMKKNKEQHTVTDYSGIVANSREFASTIETASKAARYKSTVLLLGETGTGKDVIARLIHYLSVVKEGPFIKVNCGAIPENLLESELFGYEAGAFTGASRGGKKGFFELADKGTIFLDEVGDLPLHMQVKLLSVLQEKKITRIGGGRSIPVDIRIIAATNKELSQMVKDGSFRSDLYYRLNVIPIKILPLRERKSDIIPLAYHFLEDFNNQYETKKEFSSEVPGMLKQYYWPGNVRELENIIERVVVTSKGSVITLEDFPPHLFGYNSTSSKKIVINSIIPLKEAREEIENAIIMQAYKIYKNTYKMAELLEVSQSTVARKLKKLKENSQ